MAKEKSRPVRWGEAVGAAMAARDKVTEAADELASALSDLRDIQSEYQDWLDNLPENLQNGSALAEKLEAVCELELESDNPLEEWETVNEAIDNADGMELPLGFGRD
jgi:hypothetical protein